MPSLRHLALALLAAPLALAIAACGSDEEEGLPQGEPIAAIAAPAGTAWTETASETPEGGVVVGNPDAPLKLVEYASHTCPHCAEFAQAGAAGIDEYVEKGILSYELRNQIHDPLDLTIAMLARCGPPTSFQPLANQWWGHFQNVMTTAVQTNAEAMQAAQSAPAPQRFQAIGQASGALDFFAARGISRDQAMTCLADTDKAQQIVDNSTKQSDELSVTGTPTFFLNGTLVPGTRWVEDIKPALERAGAR